MTLETLQAEIETLRLELESKSSKIGELSKENAKWRRQAQGKDSIDPDEFAKISDELDSLRGQYAKETKSAKAEIDRLSKAVSESETKLSSILVDGGLTEAMAKVGVRPELMGAAKALLKSNAIVKDGAALLGDKPLAEAVAAWATGDEGKHFVAAPVNTGGGANGGNANPVAPKGNLGGDRTQRTNAIAARFPELAAS